MKGQKWKERIQAEICTCHSNTLHCLLLGSTATSSVLRHAGSLWRHTPLEAYGVITGHRFAHMRAALGLTPGLLNNEAHPEFETWRKRDWISVVVCAWWNLGVMNGRVNMKWGSVDVKNHERFSHYTHAITFKFEQFEHNKQSRGDRTHLISHTDSNLTRQTNFFFFFFMSA